MKIEKPIAERDLEAVADLSRALSRARDAPSIGRALVEAVCDRPPIEFALLLEVDDAQAQALGVYGLSQGREVAWAPQLRIELEGPLSGTAAAVKDRQPIVVEDAATSTVVNQRLVERTGVKSIAFVPAVSGERAIGVLVLATLSTRYAFAHDELTLAQALAAEAGLALERSRTEEALSAALARERLGRIDRPGRFAPSSISTPSSRSRRARPDLPSGWGGASSASESPSRHDADRLGVGRARLCRSRERGESSTGDEPRGQRAAHDHDRRHRLGCRARGGHPSGQETLLELGTRSALATPIVVFDRMIGVLGLHRGEPWAWTGEEVALAEAVAREIGLAVHTAEILGENRERLKQQQALVKAAQAVTSELRLELVLQRLVTELTRLVGSESADCYFLDAERGVLRCAAVHGLDSQLVGWEMPADKGLGGQALRTGTAVLSEDFEQLRFEAPHRAYDGFARAIVAPMGWAGEIRGILGVGTRDPSRVYRPRDVEAVEVFASLAGLAVRNAESFEQSARQARIQRGFYRIATILSEPLSQAETLPAIAQAATEALGGDFAAVLLPGPDGVDVAGAYELSPDLAAALGRPVPALAACAEERRPLSSPDRRLRRASRRGARAGRRPTGSRRCSPSRSSTAKPARSSSCSSATSVASPTTTWTSGVISRRRLAERCSAPSCTSPSERRTPFRGSSLAPAAGSPSSSTRAP